MSNQESLPTPEIYTGEYLVSSFQELIQSSIAAQQLKASSSEFKKRAEDLMLEALLQNDFSNIPVPRLARIGAASLTSFTTQREAKNAGDLHIDKILDLSESIHTYYTGKLATVRAINPTSWPITQIGYDSRSHDLVQKGKPTSIKARVGSLVDGGSKGILKMYKGKRYGTARKTYNVRVVDDAANPLVEITLED